MLEAMISHYTKGNKAKFAILLGVSPQTISAWGARNTFDSELIYTKCSDISAEWLLTGEGPMFNNEHKSPIESVQSIASEQSSTEQSQIVKMFMNMIEAKDSKIDKLQCELRMMGEELATVKTRLSHYESSPPSNGETTEDLCDAGNVCSDATSRKPSSLIKKIGSVVVR